MPIPDGRTSPVNPRHQRMGRCWHHALEVAKQLGTRRNVRYFPSRLHRCYFALEQTQCRPCSRGLETRFRRSCHCGRPRLGTVAKGKPHRLDLRCWPQRGAVCWKWIPQLRWLRPVDPSTKNRCPPEASLRCSTVGGGRLCFRQRCSQDLQCYLHLPHLFGAATVARLGSLESHSEECHWCSLYRLT